MSVLLPQALVFDLMGTVVDVGGGVRAASVEVLDRRGVDPDRAVQIGDDTEARMKELMGEINAGARSWVGYRSLRRMALQEVVVRSGLDPLSPAEENELSGVVHRLEPWPDSPGGLTRLREMTTVVGLTNADPAELTGFSAHGGLSWHLVLSTRPSQAFKPDPRAYQVALDALELEPGEVMKVAAHSWDLRGAADVGMRTAYVRRPGEEEPAPEFELVVDDLNDLADQLSR